MLAGLLGGGDAVLAVEVPAHVLETVLHLHGQIAVHPTIHDAVIADSPIAVEAQACEVDD
jgi:hypothetical protein